MDDQRPMSGGEKSFFSLGTGRGIFIIFVGANFWKFVSFKCLWCLSSPSLMHWWISVIISCELKERITKRLKLQCMNLQKKSFRMNIFHVCWQQTFHQKYMFVWQVIYYLFTDSLTSQVLTNIRNGQRRKSMSSIIWKDYGYSWQWYFGQLFCFNTEEQSWFVH